MVDLTGFDLEIKTYFNTNQAINSSCLAILPLEPKRKLQKCKSTISLRLSLTYCLIYISRDWKFENTAILGVQKGRIRLDLPNTGALLQ